MTLHSVMQEIDADFQNRIDTICSETVYAELETSGTRAPWSKVLAAYAVKVTTDPDNPQDASTMDASKKAILESIFWDMNIIEYYTETVDVIDNSTTNPSESIKQTILYLTITHKTAAEIAGIYQFNDAQVELLNLILRENLFP